MSDEKKTANEQIGELVAMAMDVVVDEFGEDAVLEDAGIVLIVRAASEEGRTWTRTFCHSPVYHHQIGLFTMGLGTIQKGFIPGEDGDEGHS